MTKYTTLDTAGFPTAFYCPEIHGSAIPADAIEITDEQWREFLENQGRRKWVDGAVVAYDPPAPIPTLADYSAAIDAMLDAKAQERQYDSIRTAVTYRDDPNPQFAAEGQALFEWRSAVWTYATAQLDLVQTGGREQPSVETFTAEMAAARPFAWPTIN